MRKYGYYLFGRNLAVVVEDKTTNNKVISPDTSITAAADGSPGVKINYLRSPGIMFGVGMFWKDSFHISPFYLFISFLTMFWNAQYFNYEVIKSYYSR